MMIDQLQCSSLIHVPAVSLSIGDSQCLSRPLEQTSDHWKGFMYAYTAEITQDEHTRSFLKHNYTSMCMKIYVYPG